MLIKVNVKTSKTNNMKFANCDVNVEMPNLLLAGLPDADMIMCTLKIHAIEC